MQTNTVIKTLLTFILLINGVISSAQNKVFNFYTDSLKLKADNNALIKDFEQRVKSIDPGISFNGLSTVIESGAATGFYDAKTNIITLPWWETMPALFKDFGTKVAGSKKDGEELAQLFYYGFFLPHEVAHAFQFNSKREYDNDYDHEYEASVLAMLYWKKQGRGKEVKRCYEIARNVLKNLKDPIPTGEDPKTYFTKHYEDFLQDPEKYGYVMFYQVVKAYEDKTTPDFESYVKRVLQRKQKG